MDHGLQLEATDDRAGATLSYLLYLHTIRNGKTSFHYASFAKLCFSFIKLDSKWTFFIMYEIF